MRKISLVAGLALLAAACGGEKKAEETPAAAPAPEVAAPAPATGATHDVQMSFDGTKYMFIPADLTIKAGDLVRFHNSKGGPHNVSFWEDSIPEGAEAVLEKAMPNQMQPLVGNMIVEQDAVYEINFTGAPTGLYKMYCLPHLAMGMTGSITVQ
jgi:plastocyanin